MSEEKVESIQMYKFEEGKWTEFDEEQFFGTTPANPDWDARMRAARWFSNQSVGLTYSVSIAVWKHPEKAGFVIDYTDGDTCYAIYVPRLPDFIELMAKLSTIAMAAILAHPDITKFVYEFVDNKNRKAGK